MTGRSRIRIVMVFGFLIAGADPACGQHGIAPGPGWTALGAGALMSRLSFGGSMVAPGAGIGWRICTQRPFGVPDLEYREGWLTAGTPAAVAGVCWRQLGGDGMRISSCEIGVGRAGARFFIGGGCDLRRLSAPDRPVLLNAVPVLRGAWFGPEGWRGAVLLRGGSGERGWTDSGGHWALQRDIGGAAAGIGGSFGPGRTHTLALYVTLARPGLTLSAGLWGDPPAPGAVLAILVGALRWAGEFRWVQGPGVSLLWSVGVGRETQRKAGRGAGR